MKQYSLIFQINDIPSDKNRLLPIKFDFIPLKGDTITASSIIQYNPDSTNKLDEEHWELFKKLELYRIAGIRHEFNPQKGIWEHIIFINHS